ncbi:BON domain-containing protein [Devosia nitrariae]|uniref:BON domain-containing protein n=1 Tax=Devosia nitrariae TaxID=2071872 RepID=UPI0035ED7EAB
MSVNVRDGEVTLNGSVHSREDKRRAEDLADDVSGVRNVQNNLRVEMSGQMEDRQARSGTVSTH